jgi:cellulose biosynthesis protein BcsQ
MRKIAFFNNKGGVGKTTLAIHIGYMLEKLGKRVLFVDLDPQCNLTAHIFDEDIIDNAWSDDGNSVYKAVEPIVSGSGDVQLFDPLKVNGRNIWLYPGDLMLSDYEGLLAEAWVQVLAGQERGFRASSALTRLVNNFANNNAIDYVIVDVGPNFGALNRVILLDCDNIIIPMVPDLFSLRGSQNLGRVLAQWIEQYKNASQRARSIDFDIPKGTPKFSGYVLQQFNNYRKRKTKAWEDFADLIPEHIQKYVISPLVTIENTPGEHVKEMENYHFGDFKNYHSLIPMAQAALKPIFELTSKDGVVGAHHDYVKACRNEFKEMATKFIATI